MIRKVTLALSLTLALTAAIPGEALAARSRDRESTQLSQQERGSGLAGYLQRLLRRFGLTPLETPVVPHPEPTTTERKINNA